jgi:ankyrin repeat protein
MTFYPDSFDTFCGHAAHGRLADVEEMLECGKLPVNGSGNVHVALWRAAENGHVDVVDYLLRHAMFDPSADGNRTILLAAKNGHLAVVERLLQDVRERVDPSARDNCAVRCAAYYGHLAVVERLLQDECVNPSANDNYAVRLAAQNGHIAVVERLLQDVRVDPSANGNDAVRFAAWKGHLAVVERLLRDKRVDPSAKDNRAVRLAAQYRHLAVVDRLLEDDRVDVAVAILYSRPEERKRFECRERLTEICVALQDLALPAWVTVQILDAARPWSTLPLHSKWSLVCAVKHFHDKHPEQ